MKQILKKSFLIFILGLSLGFFFGCTSNVNLLQQRHSLDRYDDLAEEKEVIYTEKKNLYSEIIKISSTPQAPPYPAMAKHLKIMRRSINKIKKEQVEIEDYKTRFNQYAERQRAVTSKDKPAWEEYKTIRGEYSALASKVKNQAYKFRKAANAFEKLMTIYKIRKTSNVQLREEIEAMAAELDQGLEVMDDTLAEKWLALKIWRKAGGSAELVLQKQDVLDEMRELMSPLKLMRTSVKLSKSFALKKLQGEQQYWTGPGMRRQAPFIKEFEETFSQYKKTKSRFDVLSLKFDKIKEAAVKKDEVKEKEASK